jgi:hypothetical protein
MGVIRKGLLFNDLRQCEKHSLIPLAMAFAKLF